MENKEMRIICYADAVIISKNIQENSLQKLLHRFKFTAEK
jgi:hypothetical protein